MNEQSKTPRTDAFADRHSDKDHQVYAELLEVFTRQLETELAEANRRVAEVEADINIIYVAVVKYVEAATAMIAALKELHDA